MTVFQITTRDEFPKIDADARGQFQPGDELRISGGYQGTVKETNEDGIVYTVAVPGLKNSDGSPFLIEERIDWAEIIKIEWAS